MKCRNVMCDVKCRDGVNVVNVKCRDGDVTKFRAKSSAREENAWVLGWRRIYVITKRGTFRVKYKS